MLITYNYSIHAVYRPTNITFVSHGFWDGVHWLKGRGWSRTSSWVTCPFSMRCPILGKILYLNAYDCGFNWCLCWKQHHLNCHWFTVLVDGIPDDWSTRFRFCQPRHNVGPKFHQPIPFSNPHAGEIYQSLSHGFSPHFCSDVHPQWSPDVTCPGQRAPCHGRGTGQSRGRPLDHVRVVFFRVDSRRFAFLLGGNSIEIPFFDRPSTNDLVGGGWNHGIWIDFPYIGNNHHPNWLI